ncbi:MAG TPA: oligosaccharide flippase family protein, partial [Sediminibacterium sp.]|uniref:oligosaccharide flippase family protein n=1 Tax=Sediminibacterium sp. TaxID=1917865 RepID=UPI002B5B0822
MNSKSSAVFSFFNLSSIQAANILAQLLLIPIISRIVGLTEFGLIMLGASYAALVSIFINFGSNQSGVKEVALAKDSPTSLSKLFFSIYIVRGLLFVITSLIFLLVSQWLLPVNTRTHFLFANMIIVGELLNPFFFFVGIQQLFLYNIINLISKILSIVLILLFI